MNYIEQEYGIKLKESNFNNNSIISELIDFSIKNIEGNFCNRFLTIWHILLIYDTGMQLNQEVHQNLSDMQSRIQSCTIYNLLKSIGHWSSNIESK